MSDGSFRLGRRRGGEKELVVCLGKYATEQIGLTECKRSITCAELKGCPFLELKTFPYLRADALDAERTMKQVACMPM